jgi:putative membrane protein
MNWEKMGHAVLTTVIFVVIGLAVFGLAFWIMNKLAPFSMKKEIEEDQNTALAIIVAGVLVGIAIIIAAAVAGG